MSFLKKFFSKSPDAPLTGLAVSVEAVDGMTTLMMTFVFQELIALGANPEHKTDSDLVVYGSVSEYHPSAAIRDRLGNTLWMHRGNKMTKVRKEIRRLAINLAKTGFGSIKLSSPL